MDLNPRNPAEREIIDAWCDYKGMDEQWVDARRVRATYEEAATTRALRDQMIHTAYVYLATVAAQYEAARFGCSQGGPAGIRAHKFEHEAWKKWANTTYQSIRGVVRETAFQEALKAVKQTPGNHGPSLGSAVSQFWP